MCNPPRKVAIIGGGGMVGAATAYALTISSAPVEIILVDVVESAARGQALDIADASTESETTVRTGSLTEAGQCDIVVITAGYPQKVGETRAQLLGKNRDIMHSIMTQMQPIQSQCKILVVANPVDVLTYLAHKYSGLPREQVFGSGTYLDSNRLCLHLAKRLEVHPSSIHAYVLGEHGDRQFVGWSAATVGGASLLSHPSMKDADLREIVKEVAAKAYSIIEAKRSTYFGIGHCVASLVRAVLHNQSKIFPICVYSETYESYISWPAAIGMTGVQQLLEVSLSDEEKRSMSTAVKAIKEMCQEVDSL